MPRALRADRRELRLRDVRGRNVTADIYFDGHRVWSTPLPPKHPRTGLRRVPWPAALVPHLTGTSDVTVRNSANGKELAAGEVRFGGAGRVTVQDSQQRWLAINKWDRLGPSFDGDPTGVQDRLLKAAVLVARQMEEWGYPVYMVGGTLLGAMRSGELLPHDDDIDFAFWCDKSDPQEVSLVGFELQRQLEAAGYTVCRHSHTHLEIVYLNDGGGTDYYIDIFTGYHNAQGLYDQPFALRGPLPKESLLPTRPVAVSGVELPAPAVPKAWLSFAYGRKWAKPDPSFKWLIPLETRRSFGNSFGSFNRHRVFWEKTWMKVDNVAAPATSPDADEFVDVDRFLQLLPERAFVVDLGCGDGRHTERIAAAGHRVVGVDYAYEALRAARQTQADLDLEYRFLNLSDRHELLRYGLELVERGEQPFFFARNLLQEMVALGRADLLLFLRQVLDGSTFLYATLDVDHLKKRQPKNPETWDLPLRQLRSEAWRYRLGVTPLARRARPTAHGRRDNVTALIWA